MDRRAERGRVMAELKRCDLCGAEAKKMMNIDFPYEERWMLFFRKEGLYHYADVCLDCLAEVRRLREKQIEAENVDIEVALQTEPSEQTNAPKDCKGCPYRWGSIECGRCKWYWVEKKRQTESKGEE